MGKIPRYVCQPKWTIEQKLNQLADFTNTLLRVFATCNRGSKPQWASAIIPLV